MIRLFLSLLLLTGYCYAASDYTVVIEQVSKSGKTLFLNKGKADKIKHGDYGLLIHKTDLPNKKFIFRPVAKLKLLKVSDNRSIWMAYKVFMPKFLQRDEKLLLFSESALLRGRKKLDITRTTLVTREDANKEVRDFMLEGDSLAKKESDYQVLEIGHKNKRHYDSDVELVDVEKWEKRFGDDKLYASGIYRSPHAKEFAQRKKVQSFEKMANAFLNKFNDPSFDYEKFYKDQERDQMGYLSKAPMPESVKRKDDQDREDQKRKDEELIASLKDGGQGWSKVYSDEQLKRILKKVSLAKERQRRKGLARKVFKYQFYIGGGLNFVNNENLNDSSTTEQSKIDIETSIESYLLQAFENFEKITFELSGRRSQDAYVGSTLNVKSTEFSLAAHVNWYPFYNTNVLNQHIVYFGLLYRYGVASVSNETSNEVGNYVVRTFPGMRVSLKYNFENGYGYRIHAGFENLNTERFSSTDTSGNLPNRANYIEGKLSFSLSKFF